MVPLGEEPAGGTCVGVVPEVLEVVLEDLGRGQAAVRGQQFPRGYPIFGSDVLVVRRSSQRAPLITFRALG